MHDVDTLIQARWIVPVEPDARVLENYSVAIHEGHIVELLAHRGGAAQVPSQTPPRT